MPSGVDFPEEEIEFHQAWSGVAGEISGLETAIALLKKHASATFLQGQDSLAMKYRSLATELEERAKIKTIELREFIKESERRRK